MESSRENKLSFRPFLPQDKEEILNIWREGRESLSLSSVSQWQKGDYPGEREFFQDLESGEGIAVVLDSMVVGVFALTEGEEADYSNPGLSWERGGGYLTIHRSAVKKEYRGKGIMGEIISFSEKTAALKGLNSLRTDTHPANRAMRRALEKNGFQERGSFLLSYGPEEGDGRIAYEKVLFSD